MAKKYATKITRTSNPGRQIHTSFKSSSNRSSTSSNSRSSSFGNIPSNRNNQFNNYVGALNETFDKATAIELENYQMRQDDLDLQKKYFDEDFAKITSRKTADYFTGISLQNEEFSKSMDNIQNYTKRVVGTFEGLGAAKPKEATREKTKQFTRYKLDFDRGMEDLNTNKTRTTDRFNVNTSRLTKSKNQFIDKRATDKKVMDITAKGNFTQYYDRLVTDRVLQEDRIAKQKEVEGGGTGIQNLFKWW